MSVEEVPCWAIVVIYCRSSRPGDGMGFSNGRTAPSANGALLSAFRLNEPGERPRRERRVGNRIAARIRIRLKGKIVKM